MRSPTHSRAGSRPPSSSSNSPHEAHPPNRSRRSTQRLPSSAKSEKASPPGKEPTMAIETPSNIHAALTIYATTDMGPASPTPLPANDPPRFDELPAINSLGCVAFDLRQILGPQAIGGY